MQSIMEEYCLGDEVLRIYVDECAGSPREGETFGNIIGWHRRYQIGDLNPFSTSEDFCVWLKTHPSIVLNLYMYDHSGVSLNTTGFSDPWDSGQIGYVFVELEKVRRHYGKKRVSKKTVAAVQQVLREEVESYSQYLKGEVYGFSLQKTCTCVTCQKEQEETLDSCGGFYGSTSPQRNGMINYLPKHWQTFLQPPTNQNPANTKTLKTHHLAKKTFSTVKPAPYSQ